MSAQQDKTGCCDKKDKSVCDYNEFRRPRYFQGMLLDDKSFKAEQGYHSAKRRLLNRMLYGPGVVCGLDLTWKKDGPSFYVEPGLALDCRGNEIWVETRTSVDLTQLIPPKDKPNGQGECPEDTGGEPKPGVYYLGIRYNEIGSDPVSVYLPGASCDDRTCDYSRTKEGYCIEIVPCPDTKCNPDDPGLLKRFCDCDAGKIDPMKPQSNCQCGQVKGGTADCKCSYLEDFCSRTIDCPGCGPCDKPQYVVLGKIEWDEKNKTVTNVCVNECRQYVLTGRLVQQLLTRLLCGSDYIRVNVDGNDIPLPDITKLVENPITALCWFLRYGVVESGKWSIGCAGVKTQPGAAPVTHQEFDPVITKLDQIQQQTSKTLDALQTDVRTQVEKLRTDIGTLQDKIGHPPPNA